jgi:hypothetical protein
MPIYLLKHSYATIWALMTTVTSFQSATSLAKRLNRHLGDHLDAAALKLVDDVAGLGAGGMPLRIVTRHQYSLRIVTRHQYYATTIEVAEPDIVLAVNGTALSTRRAPLIRPAWEIAEVVEGTDRGGSHQTHCRRKRDSNPRPSLARGLHAVENVDVKQM